MEDLWKRSYPFPSGPSLSSYAAECLSHDQIQTPIKSTKCGQPRTCTDDDTPEATVLDAFATKSPHHYCLLGKASSVPVVQIDRIADVDSSPEVMQCWQKFVANVGDQGQTLTCNSRANSRNPLLRPSRNNRSKKAGGGGGHDHVAGRVCPENGHAHKLMERQRRSKMKTLCSKLTSLLPEEYRKVRFSISQSY